VWFSVMMAINLNMAFISPPVGFSLFYLQSVKPDEVQTRDIHLGALPFMVLQSMGLLLVMFLPETVTWLLKVFEFRSIIDVTFLPGGFLSRLVVGLGAFAAVGVLWAIVTRARYNRRQLTSA